MLMLTALLEEHEQKKSGAGKTGAAFFTFVLPV